MSSAGDVRADLVAKLVAGGVPAVDNPAATPPFVLVGVPEFVAASGIGAWEATFPVWVVTPPPDTVAGLAWRLDMLEAVYGALGFGPAFPDSWGDRDAPAYRVTYPCSVPNPNC